jgi:hypothetical protein
MRYLWLLTSAAAAGLVAGCTIAPNVDMTYVMPKARTLVTVTQTIACTNSNYIVSVANGTVTTSYVPDYDAPRGTINFSAPDSWFVDTDTGVILTDDGRLSSINAAYTGEAAAVVKSLVALAGTFVGAAAVRVPPAYAPPGPNPDFCARLKDYVVQKPAAGGGADKSASPQPAAALTLNYVNQFDFQQTGDTVTVTDQSGKPTTLQPANTGALTAVLNLPPDANSSPFVMLLQQALGTGTLAFTVTVSTNGNVPIQPTPEEALASSGKSVAKVPKLNVINFVLTGPVGDLSTSVASTVSQAVIPTRDLVSIPIGESRPFGKITTVLTVAGSGLVNKLEYNKGSGAADLVTAASQIASQTRPQPQTAAQRAAEIQGQADLIYQQQRLVICQATPTQCPSK